MIRSKKIVVALFSSLLLSLLATPFLFLQKAFADVAGVWIDASTIEVDGEKYIDSKIAIGESMDYYKDGDSGGDCVSFINGFNGGFGAGDKSKATFNRRTPTSLGGCTHDSEPINISGNHLVIAHWVDGGTIQLIYGFQWFNNPLFDQINELLGGAVLQTVQGQTNLFGTALQSDSCMLTVSVDANDPTKGSLQNRDGNNCDVVSEVEIVLGSTNNRAKQAGTGTVTGSQTTEERESCESASGALGWIMCPGITLASSVLNWVDTQLQGLLIVDESTYEDEGLRNAWRTIRNIAYIILIPIMLVMVIGTALGFEVFSAYTVKKALPRMIIATIFITLSWYITSLLIDLANVIGTGILGLMTAPFGVGHNMSLDTLFSGDVVVGAGKWVALGAGIGTLAAMISNGAFAGIGGAVIGIIGLFVLSALLILMTAYFVLVMRQMFIIALTLLAPVAILAWIFPGNDKLWKLWWNSFSKLLIMFPLIMAVLAAGRIFAFVIDSSDGGSAVGPFVGLMKFVAYVAPYVFVPFAFKFAGGIFANVAGFINNKEKGIFDRLRNARGAVAKDAHNQVMSGKVGFSDTRLGRGYRRVARGGRDGSWSMTDAGRSRWKQWNEEHLEKVGDESLKEGGPRAFNNDDIAEVLAVHGISRDEAIERYMYKYTTDAAGNFVDWEYDNAGNRLSRTNADGSAISREDALDAINRAELATGARVGSSAMALSSLKFRLAMTNTAYEADEAGYAQIQAEIARAVRAGLTTEFDAAGWLKSNRGRTDFATAPFMDTVAFASGRLSPDAFRRLVSRGADPREKIGGHQRAVETFAHAAREEVEIATENINRLHTALDQNMQTVTLQVVDSHGRLVNQTVNIGTEQEIEDLRLKLRKDQDVATADLNNIHSALSQVSSRKAREFADGTETAPGALSMPITYEVKVQRDVTIPGVPELEIDGITQVIRDGQPIWITPPRVEKQWVWETKTGTGRTLIEDTRRRVTAPDGSDGWYFDRVKEWSSLDEAQAADRQAQWAAEQARRQEEENN